jgi:hypothetical protein
MQLRSDSELAAFDARTLRQGDSELDKLKSHRSISARSLNLVMMTFALPYHTILPVIRTNFFTRFTPS